MQQYNTTRDKGGFGSTGTSEVPEHCALDHVGRTMNGGVV
jgi:hypothetical protein